MTTRIGCVALVFWVLMLLSARSDHLRDTRNTTRIIISRYKENITESGEWLLKYGNKMYTIMNRGPEETLGSSFHSKKLSENLGRESYVYLQYIIHNYDNLAMHTIFGQADSLANPVFRADSEDIIANKLYFNEKNGGFAFLTQGVSVF